MKHNSSFTNFLIAVGSLASNPRKARREENRKNWHEAQRLNRAKFVGSRGCFYPDSRSK